MDIVEAFTLQLKLPENAARGLAGQLLGLIEDLVREKVSYGMASRIRDAVPEMIEWQTAAPTLAPGSLDEQVTRAEVLSIVGGLPLDIARRQNDAASERLGRARLKVETEVVAPKVKSSKGSATLVWTKLESGLCAGESWLGERGVSAEEVGRVAAEHFLSFVESGGSFDVHLGDQVLLPAALAAAGFLGPKRATHFVAAEVTEHLTTHVQVIQKFLELEVAIDGREVQVG